MVSLWEVVLNEGFRWPSNSANLSKLKWCSLNYYVLLRPIADSLPKLLTAYFTLFLGLKAALLVD